MIRLVHPAGDPRLSPHFLFSELCCHCGCQALELDELLLNSLEELRHKAGVPVVVHCGYRCPVRNREVGGMPDSQHLLGKAADLHLADLVAGAPVLDERMPLEQQYRLANSVAAFASGGIGVYDSDFLHVDVRGHRARWARVRGDYVGIEALVDPEAA